MHNSSNNRFAAICSKASYRWVFGILLFLFTLLVFARFALPVNAAISNADDSKITAYDFHEDFFDPMECLSDFIEHVSHAIVSIEVRSTVVPSSESSDDIDPLTDFFVPHEFLPNYPYYEPWLETPSHKGFLIHPDGYIVTDIHEIENTTEISVTLSDGSLYAAKWVPTASRTDLAVLKIEADEALPFADFGISDRLHDADLIIAVADEFVGFTFKTLADFLLMCA